MIPKHLLPSTAVSPRIHHRHSAQSVGVSLASRLIVKNAVRVWSAQPNRNWGLEYVDSLAGLLPRFGSTAQIQRVRLDQSGTGDGQHWLHRPDVPWPAPGRSQQGPQLADSLGRADDRRAPAALQPRLAGEGGNRSRRRLHGHQVGT